MSKLSEVIRQYRGDTEPDYNDIVSEICSINTYVQSVYHAALEDEKNADITDDVWERVFDAVFNENVSQRVRLLSGWIGNSFDWYDPDTTYEADATAFIDALNSYVSDL